MNISATNPDSRRWPALIGRVLLALGERPTAVSGVLLLLSTVVAMV